MRKHFCQGARIATLTLSALYCAGSAAATGDEAGLLDAPEVNVWADSAPLNLVIEQLGDMSQLNVAIEGELEGHVSGRYAGSLQGALSSLSSTHGVLFDLQDDTLHVTSEAESSSVSIALAGQALVEAIDGSLGKTSQTWSGNSVEFREDAVRITGHPNFVKRTAKQLTTQIAGLGSKTPEISEISEISEIVKAPEAPESVVVELPPLDDFEVEPVSDAGSQALLQDIQEEGKPDSERASLSKPIRWVTDIPGFTTF